jgi:hypothetical protein
MIKKTLKSGETVPLNGLSKVGDKNPVFNLVIVVAKVVIINIE